MSPFFTQDTVTNYNELKNVSFGFPFPFLVQDQSGYTPPYPSERSFLSPQENPTSIKIGGLIASFLTVNGLIYLIRYLLELRKQ